MVDKLALIFDYQNIAMRSLFACSYSNEDVSSFDTQEECNILIRKMAMDMSLVIRTFHPDRVIIATDSYGSWRKSLYEDIEGEEYKGNRKKDETKNWPKIFRNLDDFKEILSDFGFVVTSIRSAEADDIAALWKRRLDKDGQSVLFVSSDKDWLQLLDFRESDKWFCNCYNPISNNKGRRILSVTAGFDRWLKEEQMSTDIFFSNKSNVRSTFSDVSNFDKKIAFAVVDPDKVLLTKAFAGDDGDNVPSFMEYFKNGRKVRMTELKTAKLCEALKISTMQDLLQADEVNAIRPVLEKVMGRQVDDFDISERIRRQRLMVELTPDLFPEGIVSEFEAHADKVAGSGYVSTVEMKMQDILKGTKFLDADYDKPKENSIFTQIKDLEKYIKPVDLF